MKKFHLLGAMLVAVFAFAMLAASASATITTLLAEWLLNGVGIGTGEELEVLAEGELTLRDLKGGLFGESAAVLCSGKLDGFILADGEDLIEDLLDLPGNLIPLVPLEGAGLSCTNVENCPSPKVWAINLTWLTLLELIHDEPLPGELTEFFVILITEEGGGEPGWLVDCSGVEDECKAPEAALEVFNNGGAGDVEGVFSDALVELLGIPFATCSRGGANSGHVISDAGTVVLITHVLGGTLAVSSE